MSMTVEEAQAILDEISKTKDIISQCGGSPQSRWSRNGSKINGLVPTKVLCNDGTTFHLNQTWIGDVPTHCQIKSDREITDVFVDGMIPTLGWATMHPDTHADVGNGLGTGRGQMYRKVLGKWFKVT